MKIFNLVLILIILVFSTRTSSAQGCCSISFNSFESIESKPLEKGSFKVGLSYWYINSSAYFNNNLKVPDPLKRTALGNNLFLDVEFGIFKNLSLSFSVPYSFFYRETIISEFSNVYRNDGIGDVFALLKVNLVPNLFETGSSFAAGLGVKLPTGKNTAESNGIELPIDLQTGTGAFDFTLWSLFLYPFENFISFSQSIMFRISTANPNGYKFGNELTANSSFLVNLFKEYIFLNCTMRLQKRWKDKINEEIVVNSGRFLIELFSGFLFKIDNLNIKLSYGLPVYTFVDGFQLSILNRFGIEVKYLIF